MNRSNIALHNTQFQAKIDAELSRASAAELINANLISAETVRASASELVLTNNLSDETARSILTDNNLEATKQNNLIDTSDVHVKSISFHQGASVELMSYQGIVDIKTSIQGVNDGLVSEVIAARLSESNLNTAIVNEASTARTAELLLRNDLASEVLLARSNESTLTSAVASEVLLARTNESTLTNSITTTNAYASGLNTQIIDNLAEARYEMLQEQISRGNSTVLTNNNVTQEKNTRISEDRKMVFCHMMEFEGLMSEAVNYFPFCSGYGSPSGIGFGLSIPFTYKLVGISFTCVSTDASPSVTFSVQNYLYGSVTPTIISSPVMGVSKYFNSLTNAATASAQSGNLCIKITAASGCTDINAKYRCAVYIQSQTQF